MALNSLQQMSADILALRILLGKLIVRLTAGSKDPAQTLKVMRDGAFYTATNAQLRDTPDATVDDIRKYMQGTINRFFGAMRINGLAPGAAEPAEPPPAPPLAPMSTKANAPQRKK